ncbi:MAG: hypothetical protein AAF961_05595 [Planctomycetota bacterium]
MTITEFLLLLLIAGVCGAIAQSLAGFSRGGCLTAIALGVVGALIGLWLARMLDLPEIFAVDVGDRSFPIVWSILGGALFAALLGALSRRRRL